MSNNALVLPDAFNNAQHQQALAKLDPNWNTDKPEIGSGIRRGFAVVSIKGKVFRITHQGTSRPVLRPGTNEAAGSVDVVIVRGAEGLSKVYYKDGYVEGNQDAPDCFSHDGVKPDRSVQTPQCGTCAACPHNVWGSKITEQGKQTKACADSKRLAVVPAPNPDIAPNSDDALDLLDNQMFGGAMLLRIPAASLADLAAYEAQMLSLKYPAHAVVTRLGFDLNAAYPKLTFAPVRPLEADEFGVVMEHRDGVAVKDMLNSAVGDAAFRDEPAPHNVQPVQQPAPAPVQQPAPAPAPAPAAPAPVQQAAPAEPAAPRPGRRRAAAAAPAAAPAPAPAAAPAAAPTQPAPANPAPVQQPQQAAPSAAESDLDSVLAGILGD